MNDDIVEFVIDELETIGAIATSLKSLYTDVFPKYVPKEIVEMANDSLNETIIKVNSLTEDVQEIVDSENTQLLYPIARSLRLFLSTDMRTQVRIAEIMAKAYEC